MANTSIIWQQAAHATCQLLSPSRSARAIQYSTLLTKNVLEFTGKKPGEWTISRKMTSQEKQEDQAEKEENRQEREIKRQHGESRQTSDITDLPSGSTPYSHALIYSVTSIEAAFEGCMCIRIPCHLHFWQNGRDLLRATAVTRGWYGYRNKSQQKVDPGQKTYSSAHAGTRTRRDLLDHESTTELSRSFQLKLLVSAS